MRKYSTVGAATSKIGATSRNVLESMEWRKN